MSNVCGKSVYRALMFTNIPVPESVVAAVATAVALGLSAFGVTVVKEVAKKTVDETPVIGDLGGDEGREQNLQVLETMDQLRQEHRSEISEYENEISEYESNVSDYERILSCLNEESLARERLIENYWMPLHALVIAFTKIQDENGEKMNFIKEKLEANGQLHQLTGSTWIVPPRDVPDRLKGNVDSREEMASWLEEDIYGGNSELKSHIAFAGLVDLRNVCSRTDYEEGETSHFISTVDEELRLEEIFSEEAFSEALANQSVDLTELIEAGDIAFFASKGVTRAELDAIHENQETIESRLGNPSLRGLASDVPEQSIAEALSPYVAAPSQVAQTVKQDAELWAEHMYLT